MKSLLLVFLMLTACAHQSSAPKTAGYQGHGADSLPADVVRQFAPPAVEPALLARVQKMLDLRGSGGGLLSPDGKTLFFNWGVTGITQVWRMDGALSYQRQMTAGQDMTAVVGILPNGRDVLIARDRGGEENPGLYLQSVEGGPLREVFRRAKVRASLSYVSDDSKTIYFTANSESPESYAIHKFDIASGRDEVVFKEPGTWSVADVKGDEFLLEKSTGSLWSEFSVWNAKTGALAPLLGQGEKEDYSVDFGAEPGTFLVRTPKGGDFRRLFVLKNGTMTPITGGVKKELEGASIDRARKRIYLTWNDRGYTSMEVLDARTFRSLAMPVMKDVDHMYPVHVSRDGRFFLFAVETAAQPRTLYRKDWSTGEVSRWLDPSTPEVETRSFARSRLDSYKSRDGVDIPMFVREPRSCDPAPCPIVVLFHGGPEGQSPPGFNPSAQLFVDAGFVLAEPNVRGSEGYGKSWLAMDDGPKRLNVITDLEDASIALKQRYAVNGQAPKIGVMGGSYGGYATLYAMTRFAGAYDAGASNVGMSNLITFLNNTAPYRRHLRISEYGDPEKDEDALVQLSPITHLNRVKGPLLIVQGLNDPRVPAGEAVQMYRLLRSRGLPSELILFPDEGHGSAKRDNRAIQLALTLKFFEKYLR